MSRFLALKTTRKKNISIRAILGHQSPDSGAPTGPVKACSSIPLATGDASSPTQRHISTSDRTDQRETNISSAPSCWPASRFCAVK